MEAQNIIPGSCLQHSPQLLGHRLRCKQLGLRLTLIITDLAWCHLPHCDLWQWILPNWGAWFLLGQVNRERRPKSKLSSLLCSAWPFYWCSYLEPSCSATVWRASGWERSGGGGGRLPAYSSQSRWFALKWVQQMFCLYSFFSQTGNPLIKPESKDGWDEHQDHCLWSCLWVLATAFFATLHHLLEVGHIAFRSAGG